MSTASLVLDDHLLHYVRSLLPPDEVAESLRRVTDGLGRVAEMQVSAEQAAVMRLLTTVIGARTVVEVGTFTGGSTLALARGVGPGGRVLTFDLEATWAEIGRRHWAIAGVADRVEVRIGPAAEQLSRLPTEPFVDLVFIDAEKTGYVGYWEALVPRVRPGGLLLVDNVLYGGEAADAGARGNAAVIRRFNDHVREDARVEAVLLPLFDGLTVARRLPAGTDTRSARAAQGRGGSRGARTVPAPAADRPGSSAATDGSAGDGSARGSGRELRRGPSGSGRERGSVVLPDSDRRAWDGHRLTDDEREGAAVVAWSLALLFLTVAITAGCVLALALG